MTAKTSQSENSWLRARNRRDRRVRRRRGAGSGDDLPAWKDLSDEPETDTDQSGLSTIRFALIVAALATGVTLYVGHVHATKAVRANLQEARTDNRRLHQELHQLKSEYAQRTAPAVIYERARQIGLREDPAYGPNVEIEEGDSG